MINMMQSNSCEHHQCCSTSSAGTTSTKPTTTTSSPSTGIQFARGNKRRSGEWLYDDTETDTTSRVEEPTPTPKKKKASYCCCETSFLSQPPSTTLDGITASDRRATKDSSKGPLSLSDGNVKPQQSVNDNDDDEDWLQPYNTNFIVDEGGSSSTDPQEQQQKRHGALKEFAQWWCSLDANEAVTEATTPPPSSITTHNNDSTNNMTPPNRSRQQAPGDVVMSVQPQPCERVEVLPPCGATSHPCSTSTTFNHEQQQRQRLHQNLVDIVRRQVQISDSMQRMGILRSTKGQDHQFVKELELAMTILCGSSLTSYPTTASCNDSVRSLCGHWISTTLLSTISSPSQRRCYSVQALVHILTKSKTTTQQPSNNNATTSSFYESIHLEALRMLHRYQTQITAAVMKSSNNHSGCGCCCSLLSLDSGQENELLQRSIGCAVLYTMQMHNTSAAIQAIGLDILRHYSIRQSYVKTSTVSQKDEDPSQPPNKTHHRSSLATQCCGLLDPDVWRKSIPIVCYAISKFTGHCAIQLPGLALLAFLSENAAYRSEVWNYRYNVGHCCETTTTISPTHMRKMVNGSSAQSNKVAAIANNNMGTTPVEVPPSTTQAPSMQSVGMVDTILRVMVYHRTNVLVQCNATASLCWLLHHQHAWLASRNTQLEMDTMLQQLIQLQCDLGKCILDTLSYHNTDPAVFGNCVCLLTALPIVVIDPSTLNLGSDETASRSVVGAEEMIRHNISDDSGDIDTGNGSNGNKTTRNNSDRTSHDNDDSIVQRLERVQTQLDGVIARWMQYHIMSPKVQACCMGWMLRYMSTPVLLSRLVPFLPTIVESMQQHLDNGTLQGQGCYIVAALAEHTLSHPGEEEAVRDCDCMDTVLAALDKHRDDARVKHGAAWYIVATASLYSTHPATAAFGGSGDGVSLVETIWKRYGLLPMATTATPTNRDDDDQANVEDVV